MVVLPISEKSMSVSCFLFVRLYTFMDTLPVYSFVLAPVECTAATAGCGMQGVLRTPCLVDTPTGTALECIYDNVPISQRYNQTSRQNIAKNGQNHIERSQSVT